LHIYFFWLKLRTYGNAVILSVCASHKAHRITQLTSFATWLFSHLREESGFGKQAVPREAKMRLK
jgi:hypothetical protein